MTELELFQKTVNHEYTGKFLFYAEFIGDLLKRYEAFEGISIGDIYEKYGLFAPCYVQMGNVYVPKPEDFEEYFADFPAPAGAFIGGTGVMHVPGSMFHFTRYISPLRNKESLEDIEKVPLVSFEKASKDGMKEAAQMAHDKGKVVYSWVGHMYEDAWQIRGYEEFLMDMISAPENCEYLLDRISDNNLIAAAAAAESGADVIKTGDDVANQRALMFGTDLWRKFMKPRWQKVYEKTRSIKPDIQIWYHSDGNIWDIIPDLIDIGVTILNPVQPECMDLEKVKKEFGKHLVLDGVIGTQTTMPFGNASDVKKAVRDAKTAYGHDGALIISPTHVLEPEVPLENVKAFFEECMAGI